MDKPALIMALAKVIIAAGWIDSKLTNEEINHLKDLLFKMPELTASDWAELEVYMETPVYPEERTRLVENLKNKLVSKREKNYVINKLQESIKVDGIVTPQEKQVLEAIVEQIVGSNVSIFGQLGRLLMGEPGIKGGVDSGPNREAQIEDFIKNRVYFHLQRRMQVEDLEIQKIPESQLKKLSLAGGLMARVAYVDRNIHEGEVQTIINVMVEHWGLSKNDALVVGEVATNVISKDLDYYRLSREFFETTHEEERIRFLDVLFKVAEADGFVTYEEIEEIRSISKMLKLTHKDFIQSKKKIDRQKRAN